MFLSDEVTKYIKSIKKDGFYLYDLNTMNKQMQQLSILPKNVKTYYAMKANPNPKIVANALIHKNIHGIEVASLGEIKIALTSGAKPNQLVYTGPGKTPEELTFSVKHGLKLINLESLLEAKRVDAYARELGVVQSVLIRLNTKHKIEEGKGGVHLGSGDTQFGFPQEEAKKYLDILMDLKNIKIEGFHMYPATGVIDAEVLLKSVESTFEFIKEIETETGLIFPIVDFGGGFGIDYGGSRKFDIKTYSEGLVELIDTYGMSEKELILELGRYIVADAGYFVTRINDIKTLKSGTKAVICRFGTNAHKRPQVLNVNYHIDSVSIDENEFENLVSISVGEKFNVYGPFCTSVDILASNKNASRQIKVGDYIVMLQSGAYGKSMSPQDFLSHPRIEEIILGE